MIESHVARLIAAWRANREQLTADRRKRSSEDEALIQASVEREVAIEDALRETDPRSVHDVAELLAFTIRDLRESGDEDNRVPLLDRAQRYLANSYHSIGVSRPQLDQRSAP